MNLSHWPILTLITFLPLIGALFVFAIPREDHEMQRSLAFIFSLITFALSVVLAMKFQTGDGAPLWQFDQQVPWIPILGATYHVGIDGVSLLLILLTTLLTAIGILSSYSAITERVKSYYAFLLLLETGMLGVFIARDLLLFYLFWEAMLIPMYFIIGVWGGPNRIRAAIKFFLYTMVGSLLMLVSILVLYFYHIKTGGFPTFDLYQLQGTPVPGHLQGWLFFAFFLAFAIKVPMFPFHTWLPEAHVEAPTAGSVILAGVLLKMGTYGFYRYAMPLFPAAARFWLPFIMVLAIIGIIYGALVAIVQKDIKKLVAYSSVSHLGFVMLGLFALNAEGVMGSLIQSINHGISTGALFLLVGMIYERRHTRQIDEYGGIWSVMPSYGVLFIIAILSSVALPGLNGFAGEFPILLGAFERFPWYAVFAATGMILGAVYLLWMFQRVFQGPLTEANVGLKDLNGREWAVILPLILLMFGIGLYPSMLSDRLEPSVENFLSIMKAPETGKVAVFPPSNAGTAPPALTVPPPATGVSPVPPGR
jgi:NADH-quinone oxidoreductase subunit M